MCLHPRPNLARKNTRDLKTVSRKNGKIDDLCIVTSSNRSILISCVRRLSLGAYIHGKCKAGEREQRKRKVIKRGQYGELCINFGEEMNKRYMKTFFSFPCTKPFILLYTHITRVFFLENTINLYFLKREIQFTLVSQSPSQ